MSSLVWGIILGAGCTLAVGFIVVLLFMLEGFRSGGWWK